MQFYTGERVTIVGGSQDTRGARGTIVRVNATRLYAYVQIPKGERGRRRVRVATCNLERTQSLSYA